MYPPSVNESDYESEHDSAPSDSEEHASDGEEIPTVTSSMAEGRVDEYKNAGRPLRDVDPNLRFEVELLDDPWHPFHTVDDFKLAKWFITSKVPRSRIDQYFHAGLSSSPTPCFRSAYKLDQYIYGLDPYQNLLAWNEGTLKHDDRSSVFFYRDVVNCVEYLLAQPAYRGDITYGPIKEYDGNGQRLYSEMHTADWWWETQVREIPMSLVLNAVDLLLLLSICCCCLLSLSCYSTPGRLRPSGVRLFPSMCCCFCFRQFVAVVAVVELLLHSRTSSPVRSPVIPVNVLLLLSSICCCCCCR